MVLPVRGCCFKTWSYLIEGIVSKRGSTCERVLEGVVSNTVLPVGRFVSKRGSNCEGVVSNLVLPVRGCCFKTRFNLLEGVSEHGSTC